MSTLVTKPKSQFMDSGLAFFINQLTKLDPKLYEPLYNVSFQRDFKLREDVSLGNESTSYILHTIGAGGTLDTGSATGGGLPYINSGTTALNGVSVDGQLVTVPLRPLAMSLSYTKLELMKAQQTGFNLDTAKFNAINTKYQMAADQMAYIGDSAVGATGAINSSAVTNVATNTSGKAFSASTPNEILNDFNELLVSVHAASGFAFAPDTVLLPFAQFGYLATTPVSTAGSVSILEFIKQNCFSTQVNGKVIDIKPIKWAAGRGAGSTDRMIAYTNDYDRIRFPMVPIAGFEPSYRDLVYSRPYVWALGQTEIVYPETVGYRDGI
ncbi:MAG TPA: DUF2184 domain-containing protein [Methanosarcina sp.]|nr:DUF2184 domain-containing protein [Methanosarcina sp.]